MSFINEITNSVAEIINADGVSEGASFQTFNRQDKYPGNNLFFTLTRSNLDDPLGFDDKGSIHKTINSTVDENGNFRLNTFVKSVNNNRKEIQKILRNYSIVNPPILINYGSFVNRRLRCGALTEQPQIRTASSRIPVRPAGKIIFSKRPIIKQEETQED